MIALFIFSNDALFAKKELQIYTDETLKNSNHTVSKMEIIQTYEELAKLSGIKICVLNFDKDLIVTKFGGEATSLLTFLHEVEKRDTIISLKFIQNDTKIAVEGIFAIQTFHNKSIQHITTTPYLKNPFQNFLQNSLNKPSSEISSPQISTLKTEAKPRKVQPNTSLKIEPLVAKTISEENQSDEGSDYIEVLPKSKTVAIVGEYVLLNKEWLKVGDTYGDYTITKISISNINFEKDGKLAIMEMFNVN